MRALLLAAGLGSRLRPITSTIPKCLVKINSKPLLEYWLDLLFDNGFERVLVNTHYLPDKVNEFVKKSKWVEKIDLIYEKKLLGTGGTLLKNRDWYMGQPIFVAHADNLTIFDPKIFWQEHNQRPSECVMTMMTFKTDSPRACGVIKLNNKIVTEFHEKVEYPPSNLANAAVYIFEQDVLNLISRVDRNEIDISKDLLPKLINKIYTFKNKIYHRDIGTIESLEAANIEYIKIFEKYDNKSKK